VKKSFLATLRQLDRWVVESRGAFPQPSEGKRGLYKHLLKLELNANGGGPQLFALRKAIAQAHVDVAANFIAARPRASSAAKVAAVLRWPNAEESEVCVFFDADNFRSLEQRAGETDRWMPLSGNRSLVRELGLRAPTRLRERGYLERAVAASGGGPAAAGQEVWVLGD
jgi:hypothetical protein